MGPANHLGRLMAVTPLRVHDCHVQVAALCWRYVPAPEVLLVTTLRTRRWILPKGWPQKGLSLAQSAAAEAYEEAGVRGQVWPTPLGEYHYLKEKDGTGLPCRVQVFPLLVTGIVPNFPEKGERKLLWLPFDQAARRIAEPQLRKLLLAFRKLQQAA